MNAFGLKSFSLNLLFELIGLGAREEKREKRFNMYKSFSNPYHATIRMMRKEADTAAHTLSEVLEGRGKEGLTLPPVFFFNPPLPSVPEILTCWVHRAQRTVSVWLQVSREQLWGDMQGKNRGEHGAGPSTAICRQRVHRKSVDTEEQNRERKGQWTKGREITGLLELKRGEKLFASRDWNKMVFKLSVYMLREDSMPFWVH